MPSEARGPDATAFPPAGQVSISELLGRHARSGPSLRGTQLFPEALHARLRPCLHELAVVDPEDVNPSDRESQPCCRKAHEGPHVRALIVAPDSDLVLLSDEVVYGCDKVWECRALHDGCSLDSLWPEHLHAKLIVAGVFGGNEFVSDSLVPFVVDLVEESADQGHVLFS